MSSWLGMNLSRVIITRLEPQLRKRWILDETLSPMSIAGPFQALEQYTDYLPPLEPTGVAVLDRPEKSNGAVNMHHLAYVEIARQLREDSITVIRKFPLLYVGSIMENYLQTMLPAASYKWLEKPRLLLAPLEAPYTRLLHFQLESGIKMGIMVLLFPILFGVSIWRCARETQRDRRATFILITCNIAWVIGLGLLFERTQNQRFRFLVDPLLLMVFLWTLQRCVTVLRVRIGSTKTVDPN
jgi:hypothetical protein